MKFPLPVLLLVALVQAAMAAPRVAILTDAKLAGVGDLITADLSHRPGIELVERAELDRVLKEQSLAAGSFSVEGALAVGRLIGADGLVYLGEQTIQGQRVVEAQFVAVRPGVVIEGFRMPLSAAQPAEIASHVASRTMELLPKVTVAADKAVRISFLGVRAPIAGARTEQLEKELALLLLHRMTHEANWFVLERRRLGAAGEEKEFASDTNAFWTGSYLLDGTLQELASPTGRVKVALTLTHPDGGIAATSTVEGVADNLPGLVEPLVDQLVRAVAGAPPAAAWDSTQEAHSYFERGTWAMRAALFDESARDADASWALGNTSDECWELRVTAATKVAFPGDNSQNFLHLDDVNSGTLRQAADFARQSLELYEDGLRVGRRPGGWEFLGVNAIRAASKVLAATFELHQVNGREEQLAHLREAVRRAQDALREAAGGLQYDQEQMLNLYAPFWYETPEETLQAYGAIARRNPGALLQYRGSSDDRLIAWNPKDAARLGALWDSFLKKLVASADVQQRIAGRLLSEGEWHKQATDKLLNELNADVTAHLDEWVRGHYSRDLIDPVFQQAINSKRPEDHAFWINAMSYYLDHATSFDNSRFQVVFNYVPRDEAEAKALLVKARPYRERVLAQPHDALTANLLLQFVTAIENKAPPETSTNAPPSLLVKEHWSPWDLQALAVDKKFPTINDPAVVGNDLWMRTTGSIRPGFDGSIVDLALATMKASIVPLPARKAEGDCEWTQPFGNIGHSDAYIVSVLNCVPLLYNRRTSRWNTLDIPPGHELNNGSIAAGRIYIGSGQHNPFSAIWQFDPEKNETKILASSRRTPAETPLDDIPPYQVETVWSAGKSLWVSVFRYQENSLCEVWRVDDDWKIVLRNRNGLEVMPEPEGSLIHVKNLETKVVFVPSETGVPVLMLGEPGDQPALQGLKAKWNFTDRWYPASMHGMTSDGKNLWILFAPDAEHGPLPTIACFLDKRTEPVFIPFSFDKPGPAHPTTMNQATLHHAPGRLILIWKDTVWFIPYKDLQQYLQAVSEKG